MIKRSFIRYTGYRPTSRYTGFMWRGVALIGIEIAPDAFGFVLFGVWFGFVKG